MALRYALLAALHESPATGYDLTQRFRTRLAHVWSASHQQVYRELGKLLDAQWVEMEAQAQADKPDRKLYRVTAAGTAALQDWLQIPQPRPAIRDPLLLKLFSGTLLTDDALQRELEVQRAHWYAQKEEYLQIERTFFSAPEHLSRHFRLQYLALRRGILEVETWLQWADELEAALF